MKNLLKTSIVIILLFSKSLAFSSELTMLTKENSKSIVYVSFFNSEKDATIQIKDNNGVTLYKELIENDGTWSKAFEFKQLPDASYYFELENNEEITIKPFSIEDNIAQINKEEEYKITKPTFTVKNNYVYISNIVNDNKPVKIEVYYEGHELAYSEKLTGENNLTRVYDFTNSKEGNYTIVAKSENRIFEKTIQVGIANYSQLIK